MVAAILSIGTELTRGEVLDTNAAWLAARLTHIGFDVLAVDCVDDHLGRIGTSIRHLAANARVVLVTGGLGPTSDDVTVEAVASLMGVPVTRDPDVVQLIRRRAASLGRAPNPASERMADVPEGATVLGNPAGSAPAFHVKLGDADCYFMPGVPHEMERIFDELLVRRLIPLASPSSFQVVLRTYGLPESVISERLGDLETSTPGLRLGYRLVPPEIDVKVRVRAADVTEARAAAERVSSEVRARLGDVVFGDSDETYGGAVGRALRARGLTLAVAESCTGGLIGALLTSAPGASEFLLLDAVTYANSAKERVLGVPNELLRGHGAVSAECVRAMAEGARRVSGADLAVAVSGLAGPGGGTSDKPVGLVHFALSSAAGTEVVSRRFQGERAMIQRHAAYVALSLVRAACAGPVPSPLPAVCG